jgi:3-oxoacyl-[acyl-carrier-protein] synthase II
MCCRESVAVKRVAITGIGVVSPLGNDSATFFNQLIAGRSGIRILDGELGRRLSSPIAAVADFDGTALFPPPRLRMLDRVSQFALGAAKQAVTQSGIDFSKAPHSTGVFIGTGLAGSQTTDEGYCTLYGAQSDRIKPFSVLMAMQNAAAAWLALEYGLEGPNLTYSTACSSSSVAIGEAARRIASGEMSAALAGGCEACLTLGALKAWDAMRTVAAVDPDNPSASCKPFSANRSGLVLGEGAAILVLEEWDSARQRGAQCLAELVGYGLSTDIAHLTHPSVEGQSRAMRRALQNAGMEVDQIDYINAHGTGTQANDAVETAAIRSVFGNHADRLAVSSTKSMHGHLLGAAGALELVAAVMAMRGATLPPTINLEVRDPQCDLDYVPLVARQVERVRAIMSNSFAFGGTDAVLIARNVDE